MEGAGEPGGPPRAASAGGGQGPSKTLSATGRRVSVNAVVDNVFFIFGSLGSTR